MIFSSVIVSAVILGCSCVPNEATSNNTIRNKMLSSSMNSGHSSDYLAILKAKCEKEEGKLTSYEKQCCQKIANAKASAPFSIIKQNTNILQFTNAIDQSLFKTLLKHFADSQVGNDDLSNESNVVSELGASTTNERDLAQCLKAKVLCLEDLTKSSLLCKQNENMQDEINRLKAAAERQAAVSLERENEIRMLEQRRDADRKEIAKLTKDLESAVQRLMTEEVKTTNLLSEQDTSKSKLEAMEKELQQCSSSLALTKQNLVKEQSNFARCTAERADRNAYEKTIAAMEKHTSELRGDNEHLRGELEQALRNVDEKDSQLGKCAELESKLMTCKSRLGLCNSNTSLSEKQWEDKYDQCSTQLNLSKAHLTKSKESMDSLQNVVLQLKETGNTCRENLTDCKDEISRLHSKNSNLTEQLVAVEKDNEKQSTQIISLKQNLLHCDNSIKAMYGQLEGFTRELNTQRALANRYKTRYQEQLNETLSEKQAKECCQSELKEIEEDGRECNQTLEEKRVELKNVIVQAERCTADHTSCNQHLTIALMQIRNCSSTSELAAFKNLHQECVTAHGECKTSKAELNNELQTLMEQKDSCQKKLAGLQEDGEQCQAANSELRLALKSASEAHSDGLLKLQSLTRQEATCQEQLLDATKTLAAHKLAKAENQAVQDQCLAKTKELAQRVGSLEETNTELNASLASLSKKYEDCDQKRKESGGLATRLHVEVKSCEQKLSALNIEIRAFKVEINNCLHAGNLTRANLTDWQRLHDSCQQSVEEAAGREKELLIQVDDWRARSSQFQFDYGVCKQDYEKLLSERKILLIEVNQYQVTTDLMNVTASECATELERKAAEALACQTASFNTNRLLLECMASLNACQNPARSCPRTVGNNTYWDVDRTIGHDDVASTEEVTGCAMASSDKGDGNTMRRFCYKQHGHLLRVDDPEAVLLVHDYLRVFDRKGKFVVEPSAYFVSSLGLDLKQYASDKETCFYVERTSTSIPELKHDKCNKNVYNAMCWAAYQTGYDNQNVTSASASDSADMGLDYLDLLD